MLPTKRQQNRARLAHAMEELLIRNGFVVTWERYVNEVRCAVRHPARPGEVLQNRGSTDFEALLPLYEESDSEAFDEHSDEVGS